MGTALASSALVAGFAAEAYLLDLGAAALGALGLGGTREDAVPFVAP